MINDGTLLQQNCSQSHSQQQDFKQNATNKKKQAKTEHVCF